MVSEDLESLMDFYREGYREGGFEIGVRMALQALLAFKGTVVRILATVEQIQVEPVVGGAAIQGGSGE